MILLDHHRQLLIELMEADPKASSGKLVEDYIASLTRDNSFCSTYRLSPSDSFPQQRNNFRSAIQEGIEAIRENRVIVIPDLPSTSDNICQACLVDDPGYCDRDIVREKLGIRVEKGRTMTRRLAGLLPD